MKIKSDDRTIIFPLNEMSNRTILLQNENSDILIQCFQSYFGAKKKSKCLIVDDDDIPLDMNEINFIYLGKEISYTTNMELKAKSVFSNEMLKYIESNPKSFLTIEKIRNLVTELETDEGMFKLSRIISRGIDGDILLKLDNFDIQSMLEMFRICDDELSNGVKQLLILNLILFPLSDNPNIIYLDRDVDENTFSWSRSLRKNDYLVINNEALKTTVDNYDLLKLSDNSQIKIMEEDNDIVKILSYMNHDLIKSNLSLQNEKNIKIYENYKDDFSSFLIKSTYYKTEVIL